MDKRCSEAARANSTYREGPTAVTSWVGHHGRKSYACPEMVSEVSVPNSERAGSGIRPPLGNCGLPEGLAVSDSSLGALASLFSRKSTNVKRVNR